MDIDSSLPTTSSLIPHHKSSTGEEHSLDDGHAEHSGSDERYPVFTIDFIRVETPFIIGIWILFASIAKIG